MNPSAQPIVPTLPLQLPVLYSLLDAVRNMKPRPSEDDQYSPMTPRSLSGSFDHTQDIKETYPQFHQVPRSPSLLNCPVIASPSNQSLTSQLPPTSDTRDPYQNDAFDEILDAHQQALLHYSGKLVDGTSKEQLVDNVVATEDAVRAHHSLIVGLYNDAVVAHDVANEAFKTKQQEWEGEVRKKKAKADELCSSLHEKDELARGAIKERDEALEEKDDALEGKDEALKSLSMANRCAEETLERNKWLVARIASTIAEKQLLSSKVISEVARVDEAIADRQLAFESRNSALQGLEDSRRKTANMEKERDEALAKLALFERGNVDIPLKARMWRKRKPGAD